MCCVKNSSRSRHAIHGRRNTIDVILNPLGVASRMNLGQVFESVCGMISRLLAQQIQYHLHLGNDEKVRELMLQIYQSQAANWSDGELSEHARRVVKDGVAMLAMPFCSPSVEDMDKFLELTELIKAVKFTLYDGQSGDKFPSQSCCWSTCTL